MIMEILLEAKDCEDYYLCYGDTERLAKKKSVHKLITDKTPSYYSYQQYSLGFKLAVKRWKF